jgi:hypothetical protein
MKKHDWVREEKGRPLSQKLAEDFSALPQYKLGESQEQLRQLPLLKLTEHQKAYPERNEGDHYLGDSFPSPWKCDHHPFL